MDFKGVIKVKKVLHFVIGDAVKKKRKKSMNQFNQSTNPRSNQKIETNKNDVEPFRDREVQRPKKS